MIPAKNEENSINKCIKCISKNIIKKREFEILVVLSNTNDKTPKLINVWQKILPINVYIKNNYTVYQALNFALKKAKGTYFVRVDARSFLPANYIRKTITHLKKKNVECAGGVQYQYGTNWISRSNSDALRCFSGTGGAKFRYSNRSGYVDTVYLGVYRTKTLRSIGGFEESGKYISEDSLMNKKIINRGYHVYLDKKLKVRYPAKNTLLNLAKQYFIYGAAKSYLVKKLQGFTAFRQLFLSVASVGLIMICLLTFLRIISVNILIFLLLSYISFIIIDILTCKNRTGFFLITFISIVTIHFAWVAGFWAGLLNEKIVTKILNVKITK